MNTKLEQAKELLIHYFSLAGVKVSSDMVSEVGLIVDLIADGISEQQKGEKN